MVWEFFHYANLARKGLIRFGNGRITVTNLRVFFFDADTMNGFANELYLRLGLDEARNLVYEVSKKGGGRAAKAHYHFSRKSGPDMVNYMAKMAAGAGWGKFTIVDPSPEGTVLVEDSPFRRNDVPTHSCDYLRGFLAGSMGYIYRRKVDCVETECISNGDPKCVFRLGRREKLLRMREVKPFASQLPAVKAGNADW